jgi:DNA-binding NtrC family response regulator
VVEAHPQTIRVLISGNGNEETIMEASDIGVHEFMKKPFSLMAFSERLIQHVDRYLDEKPDGPGPSEKKRRIKRTTHQVNRK